MNIVLKSEVGCLGLERTKGLFVPYISSTYGQVIFEFYKNKEQRKLYYVVNGTNYIYNNDLDIIYNRLHNLIDMVLSGATYQDTKEAYLSSFKYKKYKNDKFDFNKFYNEIHKQIDNINNYILNELEGE